ncbi:MAG: type II toxin-antitoxin system RelE/ParE family toxin [Ignavibacteriaceae bacterium]|nr:type II toxin-antitoxin system RelE/ParE family toxin [Ignavibacteriaceae bacterium]
MNNYRIFETDEFLTKMKKFSNRDRIFIEKKLVRNVYPQLKEEPHYGSNIKKLVDYKPETWRYRIGRYRLFYVADEKEKIIYILTIDLRKDVY